MAACSDRHGGLEQASRHAAVPVSGGTVRGPKNPNDPQRVARFDRWGLRHTGLLTFTHSAKHAGLYQKFGYRPGYFTAILTCTPEANRELQTGRENAPRLSTFTESQRELAIQACGKLTDKIAKGLDLAGEIRAVLAQRTRDVVLTYTRGLLNAFAVCLSGPGSEGGNQTYYVKFGAAHGGAGAVNVSKNCWRLARRLYPRAD